MTQKPKIQEIGENARSMVQVLLNKKFEAVTGISREDGVWIVDVEVLERRAIPDTQDILGKYELQFDGDGELIGYRRVELRHRGDMERVEEEV